MIRLAGIRVRLRLLFGRQAAEERIDDEFRFHIEMETERLVREQSLEPSEARRRALVAFGGVEKHKEDLRDGWGLTWLPGLSLDLKLGFRMLARHRLISLAGVLAIAVSVALAAAGFEFAGDMSRPRLPLPEGDRIVALRLADVAVVDRDFAFEPRALHDFEVWRDEIETIQHLTAAAPIEVHLTTEDGGFATLQGARATPSLFRLVRVQPLLGRPFTEEDARPGAPPVAVLGHDAWQRLFDGDSAVIGRTVRLGPEHAAIIGVMPEGFGFPMNQEIWTPLRESGAGHGPREGPSVRISGRLAPGIGLPAARAELETIGLRMAADLPDTHEHLRPEVNRFGRGGWEALVAAALNIPLLLFLGVVSANVATLFFARTATRGAELALRSALGASRRRIMAQLVVESLVLTALGGVLGLGVAAWGLRRGMALLFEVQQMRPPFWFDAGLSASTIAYAGLLALLSALVIGGIPALRATRRGLRGRLPQPGASNSGMRFGAIATGVIVVQVAICVAFIPVAIMNVQELLPDRQVTGFPAADYLTGRLTHQAGASGADPSDGRVNERGRLFAEVRDRLAAESAVLAVALADRMPGFNHPAEAIRLERDSMVVPVRIVAVEPGFFEMMDARIVEGRGFRPTDADGQGGVVIVDETWAREAFGGSPIGQRIRYPVEGRGGGAPTDSGGAGGGGSGEWHEIIGVVGGMERAIGPGTTVRLYRPLRLGEHASLQVYVRTREAPGALVAEAQSLILSVDQQIGVTDLMPLADVWRPVERSDRFFAGALGVVSGVILLFALMGIYALMSFTVEQRTREIGIRAALGAHPKRIIGSIFYRAMAQIGAGIVAGGALVSLVVWNDPAGLRLVAGVAAAMVGVGLVGCFPAVRRALRIQPTEALRAE